MMQTANDREFDHLTCFGRLHRSWFGRILAERKMGPAGMIVLVDEPPKQSPQMPLGPENPDQREIVEVCARSGHARPPC